MPKIVAFYKVNHYICIRNLRIARSNKITERCQSGNGADC